MNEIKKTNLIVKLLLIIGFVSVMSLGSYFTYSALNQGLLFGYVESFSMQGLDSQNILEYVILQFIKILVAFAMYFFIIVFLFISLTPLMIFSPIIFNRLYSTVIKG